MKFIDEAIITVLSGSGGSGCVSFRRERHVPRGGPDGGDGGRGGDVVFKASAHRRTLYQFRYKKEFKAPKGSQGEGQKKSGKKGTDLVIEIPPGTIIRDFDTDEILKDFTEPDESFVIAPGGRGGQGNARFKTATHQAPKYAQPGEPGVLKKLKLELKLLADVGIIGLPNAGKSTLISVISSARPKIGDYPFTTLVPNLGVVAGQGLEPFVVADIPGLIEGAHHGAGLGIRFLRHVERTRVLVHLIDASQVDEKDPLHDLITVNRELESYSETLFQKKQFVVLNKMDIPGTEEKARLFQAAAGEAEIFRISAFTGKGVKDLVSHIAADLDRSHETQPE